MSTVEVITRYGGRRHLAEEALGLARPTRRLFTMCLGTSAWTIDSWVAIPDHPTLTPAEMAELPLCEQCKAHAARLGRLPLGRPLAPPRLTAEQARDHVGAAVVYMPVHGPSEDGVITSVGDGPGAMVFVRYSGDSGSKATRPGDLMLAAGAKVWSQ